MYLKIEFKSYTRDSDTGCIVYITGSLVLSGETLFSDGFSSAPLVICRQNQKAARRTGISLWGHCVPQGGGPVSQSGPWLE